MSTITDHDKLRCVERELTFRHRVYARRVEQGKMAQAQADHEIADHRQSALLGTSLAPKRGKEGANGQQHEDLEEDQELQGADLAGE